jgi:site-specific recombinase XerD
MELLNQFSQYLLAQKPAPSRATVKNYSADVRRFVRWYEARLKEPFTPGNVTGQLLIEFKRSQLLPTGTSGSSESAPASSRSVERYISSLRKFFAFLTHEKIISTNPFSLLIEANAVKKEADPWRLDSFKEHLYVSKASTVTIKNYLLDLQQFFTWLSTAAGESEHYDLKERDLRSHITPYLLEEYKHRLLNEVKASPSTVNRKLSSLRRYILWAQGQSIIKAFASEELPINVTGKVSPTEEKPIDKTIEISPFSAIDNEAYNPEDNAESPGTEVQILENEEAKSTLPTAKEYSPFPPLRMIQRLVSLGTLAFDYSVVLPIHAGAEKFSYLAWKLKGAPVFIPEMQMTLGKKALGLITSTGLLTKLPEKKPKLVASLPKSFYAPLSISVKHAPLHQKVWYHLRFTRPRWYRQYHSYSLAHYVHAAILVISMTAGGFGIAQAMSGQGNHSLALASDPDGPPRMITFTGKLSRADLSPITANTNLRFGIYNDSTGSGSAMLWEEVQPVNPDENGSFTTVLGRIRILPQHLFTDNAKLYIGMTVENESELTPRKQIPTEVFAATADAVQGMRPITDPNAGEKNTLLALDSSGNLSIGGKADPTFQATGGSFTLSGQTLILTTTPGSNTDVILSPDGTGKVDLRRPLHNTSEQINTSGIIGAVEIDDTVAINATGSGQSALYINQNSTGPLISASVSGIAKFTLENTGAASFGDNVQIHGNTLSTTQTSFNLFTSYPLNLNIGTSATALSLGATGGVATINNSQTVLSGNVAIKGTTGLEFDNSASGITFSGQGSHLISATAGSLQLGVVSLTGNASLNPNVSIVPAGTEGMNNLGSANMPFDTLYVNSIVSPSLPGGGFWQAQNNIVTPADPTASLLLGSTASESAVWQAFATGPSAGTASSSGNLSFKGSSTSINQLNGGLIRFQTSPGGDSGLLTRMTLTAEGNLGIGTTTPQNALDLGTGTGEAQNWVSTSSRRFKEHIMAVDDPLEKIGQLQGVYYTWDQAHGGKRALGFIAEDVGAVLPEVVEWEANGVDAKGISYGHLTALAIEGIKAQQAQIDQLEAQMPGITFTGDREYHILAADGSPLRTISDTGETVTAVTGFRKAVIAYLESGITTAKEIASETGRIAALRTDSLASEFIDVRDMTVSGSLKADKGVILSLRTESIRSSDPDSALSLIIGKTELVIYGGTSGEQRNVASIDNAGNARFAGNINAASGQFSDITSENARFSETLTAKKIMTEELDLSEDGMAKLLTKISQTNAATAQNLISNGVQTLPSGSFYPVQSASPSGSLHTITVATASASLMGSEDQAVTSAFADLASSSASLTLAPETASYNSTPSRSVHMNVTPLPSGAGFVFPDISVAGSVTLSGNFILGDNAIDVVGADLELQPLKSGGVSFMAGLVTIDTSGNLRVTGDAQFAGDVMIRGTLAANVLSPVDQKDLIVRLGEKNQNQGFVVQNAEGKTNLRIQSSGNLETTGEGSFSSIVSESLNIMRGKQVDASPNTTIASSSAGTAIILPGQTQRTILTPYVKDKSLVYITPTSDTQGFVPYISRQTAENTTTGTQGSFTIQISQSVSKPIRVNWWVVN